MSLTFEARVDARGFSVALEVEHGETLALLGPNGAGKSTLLGLVSGLVRADSGRASLDGRVLFETGTHGTDTFMQPHRRHVASLSQEALLFPHLSVVENVAFGPRSAGVGAVASRATATQWLTEVEASDLAKRKPHTLSGGQAQRVAVARALAATPSLLLLDEPMAALDSSVKPSLRRMLRRVLDGRTAIIVTHDILDAYALADRVVVLDDGHIVEHGATRDVLERPHSAFTADLAGLTLLRGTSHDGGLVLNDGTHLTGTLVEELPRGIAVTAAVRPSAVTVSLTEPLGSGANRLTGVVTELEPLGGVIRVRSDRLAADVPASFAAELMLGQRVWFSCEPSAVAVYPATLGYS